CERRENHEQEKRGFHQRGDLPYAHRIDHGLVHERASASSGRTERRFCSVTGSPAKNMLAGAPGSPSVTVTVPSSAPSDTHTTNPRNARAPATTSTTSPSSTPSSRADCGENVAVGFARH